MNPLCWLGIHDWDNWEICLDDERYQERRCWECNMIQRRVIKVFGEPPSNSGMRLPDDRDLPEE